MPGIEEKRWRSCSRDCLCEMVLKRAAGGRVARWETAAAAAELRRRTAPVLDVTAAEVVKGVACTAAFMREGGSREEDIVGVIKVASTWLLDGKLTFTMPFGRICRFNSTPQSTEVIENKPPD